MVSTRKESGTVVLILLLSSWCVSLVEAVATVATMTAAVRGLSRPRNSGRLPGLVLTIFSPRRMRPAKRRGGGSMGPDFVDLELRVILR
jgi:hypothetical protein